MELIMRPIVNRIISSLEFKEFAVITGPRQCGKTSVLRMLETYCNQNNKSCYYFSLENPDILAQFDLHPEELFTMLPSLGSRVVVLIDEIQYLKNPTNFLKYHFDFHSEHIKIICSGSSAFYIDHKFSDSLAGRKQIFNLYTLSFKEFLTFKNENATIFPELKEMKERDNYISLQSHKIKSLLDEYLTFGGYPAVVLALTPERKMALLTELSQSFIKRDILESGIKNEEKFYFLLKALAAQTGGLLNLNQFANSLQLSVTAIDNYIYTFQKTFHVHLLRPFYRNLKKELTKMPKVYFNDLGMRNKMLNLFHVVDARLDKGELIENFVFIQLRNNYNPDEIRFWRTADGNEVDFVITTEFDKGFAIECKFDEKSYNPNKYAKFATEYPNYPIRLKSYIYSKNTTSLLTL